MKKITIPLLMLLLITTACKKVYMPILAEEPVITNNGRWMTKLMWREQEPTAFYSYEYDDHCNLTDYTLYYKYFNGAGPDTMWHFSFTCENGKVVQLINSFGHTGNFTYDSLGHLINYVLNSGTHSYPKDYYYSKNFDTCTFVNNNTDTTIYLLDERGNAISNDGIQQVFIDYKNPDPLLQFTSPLFYMAGDTWGDQGFDFMVRGNGVENVIFGVDPHTGLITGYDHYLQGPYPWCSYRIEYAFFSGLEQ